jgi:uncharacterized protein (TIGR03083 family)
MADLTDTVESESERFLQAVQAADPGAQVPTCPDWTADDLLWHLTEVHAFWALILRHRAQTDEESEAAEAAKPQRPADRAAVVELFREHTTALLDQLREREDSEPAWFWLQTARTVRSTRRMQAHEATMHRVDAELTAGMESAPIDPEVAADGILHGVEVMWAWWSTLPGFDFRPVGRGVELAASDLGRTWQLQPGRWVGVGQSGRSYDEPGVVLSDGEVAATVSGTAEELERWLWGRGPEPWSEGDPESLQAFREAQQAGMQ